MRIERFYHPAHYALVQDFLERRNLPTNLVYKLPEIGCIAFLGDSPIAMGFIRGIEGDAGMFDGFITDPSQHPSIRNEALDAVMKHLIERAKEEKLSKVVGYILDAHMLSRSLKHGFIKSEYELVALDLLGDQKVCLF